MVPMVDTAEEAEEIVAAAKYPPVGKRGFAVLYVDEHEGDVQGYMRRANEEIAVLVMIETATSLENVDAIAAVPGVDVLWVGSYDLTASLGIPGDFEHSTFLAALDSIVQACNDHGVAPGISADSLEKAELLLDRGFRFMAYGHDLVLLRTALQDGISHLRTRIESLSHAEGGR
jgi:2-dehydro-3-deoxyglucarate aldolase/4-hydroxy-2-oxoheptanedioate aldolase